MMFIPFSCGIVLIVMFMNSMNDVFEKNLLPNFDENISNISE
jgi:hypothetical protein